MANITVLEGLRQTAQASKNYTDKELVQIKEDLSELREEILGIDELIGSGVIEE